MSAHSRNKGSAFEREIARELDLLLGIQFKRDLEQVRAAEHGDLVPSDPAFPFSIECKRYAAGNGCKVAWQIQSEKAADAIGKFPAVIYRFDRRPTAVSVPIRALSPGFPLGEWAEISLEAFAALAREMMADNAQ